MKCILPRLSIELGTLLMSQPTNQPINQSINQPTNQSNIQSSKPERLLYPRLSTTRCRRCPISGGIDPVRDREWRQWCFLCRRIQISKVNIKRNIMNRGHISHAYTPRQLASYESGSKWCLSVWPTCIHTTQDTVGDVQIRDVSQLGNAFWDDALSWWHFDVNGRRW